jgi:hypothetical protein
MGASRLGKGATTKEQDATANPSVRSTEPEVDGAMGASMDGAEQEKGEGGEAARHGKGLVELEAELCSWRPVEGAGGTAQEKGATAQEEAGRWGGAAG